jgi:hypothetical protein
MIETQAIQEFKSNGGMANQAESAFANIQNFDSALRMANMLSKSDMVPQQYRNSIPNCVIALEMANRMGASVFAVMQNLAIVHGKPAWEAKFIIAALNSCRRFSPLRFVLSDHAEKEETVSYTYFDYSSQERKKIPYTGQEKIRDRMCYAWATDRSGERLEGPPVTLRMAVEEGWYSKNGSKWKTMPDLMLRYRAASFFGKLYAPDILMGMQTAEEIHDIIDAEPTRGVNGRHYEVKAPLEPDSRTTSIREKLKRKVQKETPVEEAVTVLSDEYAEAPAAEAPASGGSESNPNLVRAILQALSEALTKEEIVEAEDLIRELEHPEDQAKCRKMLAEKRAKWAKKAN